MTASAAAVAYAPKGLIGVLTPQANTTVEPECAILCPEGHAFVNARMTSDKTTIEGRLIDYADRLEADIDQFANAPLAAVGFACTGASYLIGPEAEDALVERVAATRDFPLATAGIAVCDALTTLAARNIALVSPYPPAITEASVGYWRSRGFDVGAVVDLYDDAGAFHPIYAMGADAASGALAGLKDCGADAIVLLGTGMPTLAAIARHAGWGGPPVFSCMLALVWRAVVAAEGRMPDRSELEAWIAADAWRDRI